MVSRDLSRLRTSRATMLCGKELVVNACMGMGILLVCVYVLSHPTTSYTSLMRPIFVNTTKTQ